MTESNISKAVAVTQSGIATGSVIATVAGNNTVRQVLSGTPNHKKDMAMDKDRVEGSAKQLEGSVKETAGKVLGDKKLETEGAADKAAGKVQNAIGGLKDVLRGR